MIEIILIIIILAYREVQILIDRGSWNRDHFFDMFWYIDWTSEWKDFDSFHVSNGLVTYLIIRVVQLPDLIYSELDYLIYWALWMYVRNLCLHIIFRQSAFREWKYLVPLVGKYIFK
jgi:hypothetical protein